MSPRWAPILQRFWEKVQHTSASECWLWIGSKDSWGYGKFWDGTRLVGAHRWSYLHHVGSIPEGLELDHLCRTPACVNPAHLEPVTPRMNQLRGFGASGRNARKTHCPRGHRYDYRTPPTKEKPNGSRQCRECQRLTQQKEESE